MRARLVGVAVHLPESRLDNAELVRRVSSASDGFVPPADLVRRLAGVTTRHLMPDDWQASDLAVAAAGKLLAETGTAVGEVDLLMFASASQDLCEPATGHIVAAKLGASCPVFDVKNACNSVLNAIELADALIAAGRYRRILIACGEAPSRAIRWRVADLAQYLSAFAGYTMSDAGAALLLAPGPAGPADPGVLACAFTADSTAWQVGTLPGGGSAFPRDPERTYFELDGAGLRKAFEALGPELPLETLRRLGLRWEDFAVVAAHQVSLDYLEVFRSGLGIPQDRLVVTLPDHGNVASASLPLQLVRAREESRCGPGDLVALVGLAGGVSLGIVVLRL
ncbi:3-oxoacyl-[acyl-carrier-protein] synthase III C-terminal domain-containing protein [Dactylosporangium sp. NPDC051484]|uniref:3-oxoacyl-ACP synthase III family protein n=1 Tax=Dactylosporangium sp. NPDC051484 TaxID=3154942 RepID=UPI003450019A